MERRELTPGEVIHAKLAGIPADRPGLLGPYPRMLYRKAKPVRGPGIIDGKEGNYINECGAGLFCDTQIADSAEHEAELRADGWFVTPAEACEPKAKAA